MRHAHNFMRGSFGDYRTALLRRGRSPTLQVERVQKCVRRTKVGQCLKFELRRGAHGKLTTTVKLGEAEKVGREAAKAKTVAVRSPAKRGGVPRGFFVIW